METVAFSIGCFHFGVKATPPFTLTGREYLAELERVLESLPNVTDIEIDILTDEFHLETFSVQEPLPVLGPRPGEMSGFFPQPDYLQVDFEIYVPYRIQAELLELDVDDLETYTERFGVSLRYTYGLPVAFVQPISPSGTCSPSEGLRVVRDYLASEIKSDLLAFEFLGPSPFHAELYLSPGETTGEQERDWKFRLRTQMVPGYDSVYFTYNPNVFEGVDDAFSRLKDMLEPELGLFYELNQMEAVYRERWGKVTSLLSRLETLRNQTGLRGLYSRSMLYPSVIKDTFIAVAQFEHNLLFTRQESQQSFRDIYSSGKHDGFLRSFVHQELEDQLAYPTKEVGEFIRFLESRTMKSLEIMSVVLAAVVGGIIGALVTAILQG